MNKLHRISVSVFFIAALSLTPAAQAIDITIADSSTVGSEISPGIGTTTDESVATDTSFPESTSVGSGGLTASADWTFVNDPTEAVFSADNMVATVSAALASGKNYVDLEFTVGSAVDYSLSGGISWTNQQGHSLAATLLLSRGNETIVEIDESVISFGPPLFPNPFVVDDFADIATGDVTGILEPGTYNLSFSVGVGPSAGGTNSATTNFTVLLSDPGGSSEPLIGGAPVNGLPNWFLSDWFGYYSTLFAPWIYHDEHGFLYHSPGSTNESMFVYDAAMGSWWWTNETDYPSLYAFDPMVDNGGTDIGAAWLWYQELSKTPRWFNVLTGPSATSWLSFNP